MLAKSPLKEKSLGSPQKQQESQTSIKTGAGLGSELSSEAALSFWAQEDSPNHLLCPPRKEEWGKEINHCKRAADVQREKRQRTWDYSCSKTNWLDKWNIMESANSAPFSVYLSPGHFICPSSSQQNKTKCIFYCKLLYSASCKRLEDFPRGNELTRDCFIL